MPLRVIFTDLDGTLLHPAGYSFEEAKAALRRTRERNVPVIIVSSKTRSEIEAWRKRLNNDHPFVSENGGAVFVPTGYFPFPAHGVHRGEYVVNVLGEPYERIRREFVLLREELNAQVRGFGDMTDGEVASLTGLSPGDASLARQREFDEPFVFDGPADQRFLKAVEERGLRWTRGRLYHLMGESDKGRAVRLLKKWYESGYGRIVCIGLGDGLNDLPFLQEVDHPVLVRKNDGTHEENVSLPGLRKIDGIGPAGWNEAVLGLLKDIP